MLPFSFFRGRGTQCFSCIPARWDGVERWKLCFLRHAAPPPSLRRPVRTPPPSFRPPPVCNPPRAKVFVPHCPHAARVPACSPKCQKYPVTVGILPRTFFLASRMPPPRRQSFARAPKFCPAPPACSPRTPVRSSPRAARHILSCAEVFPPRAARPHSSARQSFVLHKAEKPCPSFSRNGRFFGRIFVNLRTY